LPAVARFAAFTIVQTRFAEQPHRSGATGEASTSSNEEGSAKTQKPAKTNSVIELVGLLYVGCSEMRRLQISDSAGLGFACEATRMKSPRSAH